MKLVMFFPNGSLFQSCMGKIHFSFPSTKVLTGISKSFTMLVYLYIMELFSTLYSKTGILVVRKY